MNKSLLIVAHGSRRAASNDEVRTVAARVAAAADGRFTRIACAFLELAPPSIPEGLTGLIAEGAEHIVVVPYFLAAGRHVTEDIPAEVARVRGAHPGIRIDIAPYLGTAHLMPELLLQMSEPAPRADPQPR